jgi:N-acyl-L-homoserine lactone synthetase
MEGLTTERSVDRDGEVRESVLLWEDQGSAQALKDVQDLRSGRVFSDKLRWDSYSESGKSIGHIYDD